jgi:hypothetical protein
LSADLVEVGDAGAGRGVGGVLAVDEADEQGVVDDGESDDVGRLPGAVVVDDVPCPFGQHHLDDLGLDGVGVAAAAL